MVTEHNPLVNRYLVDGCMRCKYGGTPQCKVNNWREGLELLRQIILETGLKEELKWSVPVYTHKGKNVITLGALKACAVIGFVKGALLTDKQKILQQQGNVEAARIIKFTDKASIEKVKDTLQSYIKEVIAIEEKGEKIEPKKNIEPAPEELLQEFEKNLALRKAFYSLTSGRQRGYIIYFSQPKQSKTRISRIEKHKEQILKGIGLHDYYKK